VRRTVRTFSAILHSFSFLPDTRTVHRVELRAFLLHYHLPQSHTSVAGVTSPAFKCHSFHISSSTTVLRLAKVKYHIFRLCGPWKLRHPFRPVVKFGKAQALDLVPPRQPRLPASQVTHNCNICNSTRQDIRSLLSEPCLLASPHHRKTFDILHSSPLSQFSPCSTNSY
jgi:hypothetical protein